MICGWGIEARQFDDYGRSLTFTRAFGKGISTVFLGDSFHDEQSQTRTFHVREGAVGDAMKALKDALEIVGRNADSLILHAQDNALFVRSFEANSHFDVVTRIFDGIVKNVGDGGSQVLGATEDAQSVAIAGGALIAQCLRLKVMADARRVHAVAHQLTEIHFRFVPPRFLVASPPGTQDLLDRIGQPVDVAQHDAVELLFLRLG